MKLARQVSLAAGAWMLFACFYAIFGRLLVPVDIEWMTGSILDHVERVAQGKPVYAAPSVDWIPFLYPPLYYFVAAPLTKVVPAFVACRLVSIASMFVQAACVWRLSVRHGASRYWAIMAILLFFGAFGYTEYWYDVERTDSLFVALLALSAVVLTETEGLGGAAAAGLLIGLAFFAKQPAALFGAGGVAALVARKEHRRAAAFAASAGVVAVVGVVWLNRASDGWFAYYVFAVPRSHGIEPRLLSELFLEDIPRGFALVAATVFFLVAAVRRTGDFKRDLVLTAMLVAGAIASATSRLHVGGWANVLMFWSTFACIALAVAAGRIEAAIAARAEIDRAWARLAPVIPAVIAAQLLAWTFDPAELIPARSARKEHAALVAEIHQLEQKGDVLVIGRGHMSDKRHFHVAALIDVLNAEGKISDDLARPFREQRLAAIVIDSFDDLTMRVVPKLDKKLFAIVMANYYVGERLDPSVPACVVGWNAHPRWVLFPRKRPLDEAHSDVIARHQSIEVSIAETRSLAEGGSAVFPAPLDVEALSEETYDRVFGGVREGEKPDLERER